MPIFLMSKSLLRVIVFLSWYYATELFRKVFKSSLYDADAAPQTKLQIESGSTFWQSAGGAAPGVATASDLGRAAKAMMYSPVAQVGCPSALRLAHIKLLRARRIPDCATLWRLRSIATLRRPGTSFENRDIRAGKKLFFFKQKNGFLVF